MQGGNALMHVKAPAATAEYTSPPSPILLAVRKEANDALSVSGIMELIVGAPLVCPTAVRSVSILLQPG